MGTTDAIRLTPYTLDTTLAQWLDAHAEPLDATPDHAPDVIPQLARAGVLRVGVPTAFGGAGRDTADAIAAIAAVAERSLTAAFVFWGQRTFIEYLLQSPNVGLRERLLAPLLDGKTAGATGLSNAMKHLSGIEALQVNARPDPLSAGSWRLDGKLPWVTNLRAPDFVVAAAVGRGVAQSASIFAIPHDTSGVVRSADLDTMGLRGTNTAALAFDDVRLDSDWQLHEDASTFLPSVRPAFLGMQCGLSIGLARRSLAQAALSPLETRGVLQAEIESAVRALEQANIRLVTGIRYGGFRAEPSLLFELRIELAGIVRSAIDMELQAAGGRGFMRNARLGLERRWREAAFIPLVTPSLVQLKSELTQHKRRRKET
jgi:alkylation response protein AidB-like acyl-CoA dehydrogenase